ncbi:MAG: T9SS type A sorting domain-containing protein [Bacteroidia bacterium]
MKKITLILSLITCPLSLIYAQNISTYAGNGTANYSGNGVAATSAELNNPSGVATDAAGNLYIADYENNRVRVVETSGIIVTIAGNATQGYSGDGGIATAAELNNPSGVALDASGNLYIADQGNSCVRKISTSGIITTIAGNGTQGTGNGGAATAQELNWPTGVAVDGSGNLYIADADNNRVCKVTTSGTLSIYAGTDVAGFSGDGGAATAAELNSPNGVVVDASGDVYIADYANNRIRMVNSSGIISTVAGNGSAGYSGDGSAATAAELNHPYGLNIGSQGTLVIADELNNRIRLVKTSGTISTGVGNGTAGFSGDGGAATAAELHTPTGVAVDDSNNVFIADLSNNRIRKVIVGPQGINELSNNADISVYPVPNNGNFQLKITNYELRVENIDVYNILGEKVYSQAINQVQTNLNLNLNLNLDNGIYILRVITDKGIISKKIEVVK